MPFWLTRRVSNLPASASALRLAITIIRLRLQKQFFKVVACVGSVGMTPPVVPVASSGNQLPCVDFRRTWRWRSSWQEPSCSAGAPSHMHRSDSSCCRAYDIVQAELLVKELSSLHEECGSRASEISSLKLPSLRVSPSVRRRHLRRQVEAADLNGTQEANECR